MTKTIRLQQMVRRIPAKLPEWMLTGDDLESICDSNKRSALSDLEATALVGAIATVKWIERHCMVSEKCQVGDPSFRLVFRGAWAKLRKDLHMKSDVFGNKVRI